jgi:hypothetical protein
MLNVFVFDNWHHFVILQSTIHETWVRDYASSLETRLRYTPRDCFETFPFPHAASEQRRGLEYIGETYYEYRREIMIDRQEGLTQIYNRFHDPTENAADIARLRELRIGMDQAVAAAYGWGDLDLDHDFHETPQGLRYTISQAARWEVLDRLLALNHERYAEEVRAGLHENKKRTGSKRTSTRRKKENKRQPRLL